MIGRRSTEPTITADEAAALSDEALVDAVERNVFHAAFHSTFSSYDANCNVLYSESVRREAENLYERGYKLAERSADPR